MSVKPIIPSIEDNNAQKSKVNYQPRAVVHPIQSMPQKPDEVSFTGAGAGANPIVGLMDFIEQGGYAASFIIQDGLGFIAPRVGKGLLRGSLKTDDNGQPVLDENGNQKRELNWQFARKEFLREIITGPSAFLIPFAMFAGIKKWFGAGNNVKLNYINGFEEPFIQFAKANAGALSNGSELDKVSFYKNVYKNVIEKSINAHLPKEERLSKQEVGEYAEKFATRQNEIENVMADKNIKGKKAKAAAIGKLEGGTVEDMFMRLKKEKIGGAVNELAVEFNTSKGVKGGSISELSEALNDYFDDAVKSVKKSVKDNFYVENIEKGVKEFTNRRMGSRILTNLGVFSAIALFYTQIPKMYNAGIKGNPALKGTSLKENQNTKTNKVAKDTQTNKQNVAFTGGFGKGLEKAGKIIFDNSKLKTVSDIFEFDGNTISGAAMPVLLYGFCIPPRLDKAQDKYDYGEIVFRDMTSFTALLFGAKALARLFSDGFTRLTGLALNKKDLADRNFFQKVIDYLNPLDKRHSVLSSKQLTSKYTNIDKYKNGAIGFMDFLEESGGNVKKALSQDKNVKSVVEEMLKKYSISDSYKNASLTDVKDAIKEAMKDSDQTLINKFYDLFSSEKSGFVRFMDENNNDLKQAITKDSKLKTVVEDILKKFSSKTSFADASETDIKDALKAADNNKDRTLIKKFYKLFNNENKLLSNAKTYNSAFGFVSTLLLVPALIIWIANKCENMTKKKAEQDMAAAEAEKAQLAAQHLARRGQLAGQIPTMAGFLGKNV